MTTLKTLNESAYRLISKFTRSSCSTYFPLNNDPFCFFLCSRSDVTCDNWKLLPQVVLSSMDLNLKTHHIV